MKNLLLLLILPLLLSAQGRNVTCADGRTVVDTRTSPFQPDPCGLPLEEPDLDIGILLVYGPPPQNTNDNVTNRVNRATYATHVASFRGLIAPPESFTDVAPSYGGWNFGEPLFFATKYGQYVRWPDAPFQPCQATLSTALLSPGLVVATCQVRAVQAGFCVPNPHQWLPSWINRQNSKICNPDAE
jgi:hypothetical protein